MITREQCKAARGLIGWRQQDLADAAGLSKTGINNYERGLSDIKQDTMDAIVTAFTREGLEFIGTTGVLKKADTTNILKGDDSYFLLLDDIYHTLLKTGGELLVCNISHAFEQKMMQRNPQKMRDHYQRMTDAGITQRALVRESDHLSLYAPGTYRWIPQAQFNLDKFSFIYGEKTALKLWHDDMILIIDSRQASSSEQDRFERLWQQASVPPPDHQTTL